MNVLVVEDDAVKYGNVVKALLQQGIPADRIRHVVNAADAVAALSMTAYDLMLLDVNLPRRAGEATIRGGGLLILKEIEDDVSLHRPRYILGLTAFEDTIEEFGEQFADQLWCLIHYREDVDRWSKQLSQLVEHIRLASTSRNFSDGLTFGYDVAIVCALPNVELSAVKNIGLDWTELKLPHDETRYTVGTIVTPAGPKSVIAAATPRMGIPAAAVLATKVVLQFRPRLLAMVGICAGRSSKANIGDVVIADPSWDYGSGKIEGTDEGPRFLPSAHQLPLDPDFAAAADEISRDVAWLATLKQKFPGGKPSTELSVKVGPMASGAAVLADKKTFEDIAGRQRDVVAVEMEAYGVFACSVGSGKPRPRCLIAKAVSDYADKDKGDDYQSYAAYTSANVMVELIRRGVLDR